MTTKEMVERLVLDVLEFSSSFCMDNEPERKALADALTVVLLGRFEITVKPMNDAETTLARVFCQFHTREVMDGKCLECGEK